MIGIRSIAGVLLAGWLADKLASTDADVEAGIDAYEAGDHDGALGHYDRAVERLGERPEISFDRGLALLAKGEVDPARSAFERASEADDTEVRASALYELGNLALDAEDFDGAIAKYIDCLKARPDHENAKWNLELALLRKQKKDEEEEKKDEDEDQGSESGEGSESGGESGGSEEGGSEEGGSEEGGSEEGGSEEGGESGDDEKQDQKQDDQKQDDQKQDDQKQDDQKQDQKQDDQKQDQKQDDQKQDESRQAPPEPTPAERFDLQRALDQLDEQDQYPLDRARVRTAPARKDW